MVVSDSGNSGYETIGAYDSFAEVPSPDPVMDYNSGPTGTFTLPLNVRSVQITFYPGDGSPEVPGNSVTFTLPGVSEPIVIPGSTTASPQEVALTIELPDEVNSLDYVIETRNTESYAYMTMSYVIPQGLPTSIAP